MKFALRSLTAAAALLFAGSASADVTIYITGSTAFRGATSNAIKNLMTLTGTGSYNDGVVNHTNVAYGFVYDGTSFTGATHQMLIGTVSGIPGTVIVKTSWNGSLAGIQALDQPGTITVNYFDSPWNNGSVVVSSAGTNNTTTGLTNDTSAATIAMSDNTQGTTPFTNTTLTDNKVGIVPFAFVASFSLPSTVNNITSQLASALFKGGFVSQAMFTNNAADKDNAAGARIYAAGRDPLSGTRLNTFAEIGMGIYTAPTQYQYSTAPTGTSISNITLAPKDLTLLTPVGQKDGQSGFGSGGTLANMMRYSTASVTYKTTRTGPAGFITYLGEGDAVTACYTTGTSVGAGNAHFLSYNGVSAWGGVQVTAADATWTTGGNTVTSATTGKFAGCVVGQLVRCVGFGGDTVITAIDGTNTTLTLSKTATAPATGNGSISTSVILPNGIWNGTYTMWGYEHIMWAPGLAGDGLTFGNKLLTQISTVDYYTSGLALDSTGGSMSVSRSTEGGVVTQTY